MQITSAPEHQEFHLSKVGAAREEKTTRLEMPPSSSSGPSYEAALIAARHVHVQASYSEQPLATDRVDAAYNHMSPLLGRSMRRPARSNTDEIISQLDFERTVRAIAGDVQDPASSLKPKASRPADFQGDSAQPEKPRTLTSSPIGQTPPVTNGEDYFLLMYESKLTAIVRAIRKLAQDDELYTPTNPKSVKLHSEIDLLSRQLETMLPKPSDLEKTIYSGGAIPRSQQHGVAESLAAMHDRPDAAHAAGKHLLSRDRPHTLLIFEVIRRLLRS